MPAAKPTGAPAASGCPYPFERPRPAEPAPLLAELRRRDPVCPVTMPSGDVAYLVTRYRDAVRVWTDPVFSLARRHHPGAPQFVPGPAIAMRGNLLGVDPPEHTGLRRLAARSFSRRRVEEMGAEIQRLTDGLLDRMAATAPPVDLVTSLCAPLPIAVLARLFGVPGDERASFSAWADAVMSITACTPAQRLVAWHELRAYLARLIAAKRRAPAEDLLSDLATDRRAGLSEQENVNLAVQILVAGYETTLFQLGIFAYVLLGDHETRAALAADPGLVPAAVEELSRLYPPANSAVLRVATEDVEIGGVHLPAGSGVLIDFTAVNRDPDVFAGTDEVDVERTDVRHLTYGHGPHYCLGATLARAELRAVVGGLIRRFPGLRLAVEPETIPWRPSRRVVQGPLELPVTW